MERDSDASAESVRISTRAETLGLAAPPLHLVLHVLPEAEAWRVEVDARCLHPLETLGSWLDGLRPQRVELRSDRALVVEISEEAAAWSPFFRQLGPVGIEVDVDGAAVVVATGSHEKLSALARRLGAHAVRRGHPPVQEARLLTDGQDAAIREAVASGYYDVPRAINLQDLAGKLGVTSASISERLRRAEGRLIKRYVRGELVSQPARAEPAPTHARERTR